MRILPIAAPTTCTKVVKNTVLIEVVVEVELGRRLRENGWWIHSLRRSCVDGLSAYRVQEWLTSHAVKVSVKRIFEELGSKGLLSGSFVSTVAELISTTHIIRCEAHLSLVDLVKALISLTGIGLLHVAGLSRSTVWTGSSLLGVSGDEASGASHSV